jgi:hypothetical protein
MRLILCIKHVPTTKLFFMPIGIEGHASEDYLYDVGSMAVAQWFLKKRISLKDQPGYTWSIYSYVIGEHSLEDKP